MDKVKGYKNYHEDEGDNETLYAVYENGLIKRCVRPYSTSFNQKQDIWKEVSELPEQAEFIGSYFLNSL